MMRSHSAPFRALAAKLRVPGVLLALGLSPFGAVVPASAAPPAPESTSMPAQAKVLPINLDTVLRLAEEQNAQMGVARARIAEAYAEKDLAARWLPNLYIGPAYSRHEGGIQDFDGQFIHSSFGSLFGGLELQSRYDVREIAFQRINAERNLLQQKGELSRITLETLLDASGTYVDLLAARTAEASAMQGHKVVQDLLERTQKLAAKEPGARVDVARIQADLLGREQIVRKLREHAHTASAKLVYLLGLDPCAKLIPVDETMVPIQLVDVSPPVCDLVSQALANGPGVREMEGLLGLIHETLAKAEGRSRWLPTLEMRVAEGAFGAGPGSSNTWDNRLDLGLQARWNLTDCFTARDRRRIIVAKMDQAHLAYQDLRGKLTAGVQEAREAILSEREQIRLSQQQIDHARHAHKLSDDRLRNVPGTSATEALLSQQALSLAQLNYVNTIRAHNKAQLRLMMLLGPQSSGTAHESLVTGQEQGNCGR